MTDTKSADARPVSTDALETLGTIIGDGCGRDAIHIAVEPVVATERLKPGEHIGFVEGGVATTAVKKIGIVDPFLAAPVAPGQRFWMLMYPRTITSLRHVWTHPDVDAGAVVAADPVAVSRKWIEDFGQSVGLGYSTIIDGARWWVADKRRGGWGEYLNFGGLLEGESVPDEFWPHYEVVTGEKVADDHRGSFFTCSC